MKILHDINCPQDIRNFDFSQLKILSEEIRQKIIQVVEKNGGHFSSNLGVVELMVAIHYVFDTPNDKLIMDVGHQCYAHKILTGRKDKFDKLRLKNGISGFPKINESAYDTANVGHASTSLSIASGLCMANLDNDKEIITLVGDGALTGGMAWEAINNINKIKRKQIIIINDNGFSIDKSDCVIEKILSKALEEKAYKILQDLGLNFITIKDGNNIEKLVEGLKTAKNSKKSVIMIVQTHKGHGYKKAELTPQSYHGYPAYDCENLNIFSNAFGKGMCQLAEKDDRVRCITAAMKDGCGLGHFAEKFNDKFYDVEIAEAHGMTFSAGLALGGLKPYFVVYSTFLQRAFDSLLHDVCLMNLPVTVCIDRGGFVSGDGETHQGLYDINYMTSLPNLNIFQPMNVQQLYEILDFSLQFNKPLAIRYPKGEVNIPKEFNVNHPIKLGKWQYLRNNDSKIVILATCASVVEQSCYAVQMLDKIGINVDIVNACFVKPLDTDLINSLVGKTIVTIEANIAGGGFGALINNYVINNNLNIKIKNIAIMDKIFTQASQTELLQEAGLDAQSIANFIESLTHEN